MLKIDEISVSFAHTSVLRGVSLNLLPGEVTVLAGPNGAGKTTLLRAAAGLLPIENGTIGWKEREDMEEVILQQARGTVRSLEAGEIIGFLPEGSGTLPLLTVAEQLKLMCLLGGVEKDEAGERTESMINSLHLQQHRDYRADELSSGLKKRLGIALVLILDRPVYFLDEPFNGLDAEMVGAVQLLVDTLRKRRKTVCLVSHIYYAVMPVCSRLVEMAYGVIVRETAADGVEERLRELSRTSLREENDTGLPWIR